MIVIFRKASEASYTPKAKKSLVSEVLTTLAEMVRVSRPGLVTFFAPTGSGRSGFARLPELTEGERNNVARYGRGEDCDSKSAKATIKLKGFVVPDDSLGRTGRTDHKTAESIRLWIKTRMVPAFDEHKVTVGTTDGSDLTVLAVNP